MDQDKNELKGRFSEILRCVLYVAVVIFLMSCIAILFLEQQKMKQRLTAIDDKMNTLERTLRYNNDRDKRLEAKGLLVREKRALALSLEGFEKRLKVPEFRALRENQSFPGEESRARESCKGRDGRDGRDGPAGPPDHQEHRESQGHQELSFLK